MHAVMESLQRVALNIVHEIQLTTLQQYAIKIREKKKSMHRLTENEQQNVRV